MIPRPHRSPAAARSRSSRTSRSTRAIPGPPAVTLQPREFASDIAYGSAAGLLVSPVPRAQLEASLRYFF
nr:hypothetical protein [uncultured Duganella sp.]